jgi:lysophospholipase L1-like esterase
VNRGQRCTVAIFGNSVPLLVNPPRTHRADGTYGEVLARLLRDAGVDADVVNRSRMFELIHEGQRRYVRDIAPLAPDVMIFHYGVLEMQPNVLPTTVTRDLTRNIPGGRGVRRLWYGRVAPRLWPTARAWQRWASSKAGTRTWRLSPDRFINELNALVRATRNARSLALIVDVQAPNDRLEHFMPGLRARHAILQGKVRAFVEGLDDPEVRIVEASAVVEALGPEGTVDGLHLTMPAHALLAERLAKEIIEWLGAADEEDPT